MLATTARHCAGTRPFASTTIDAVPVPPARIPCREAVDRLAALPCMDRADPHFVLARIELHPLAPAVPGVRSVVPRDAAAIDAAASHRRGCSRAQGPARP